MDFPSGETCWIWIPNKWIFLAAFLGDYPRLWRGLCFIGTWQNVGQVRLLGVIHSSLLLTVGPGTAGCSGPHQLKSWISSGTETPQPFGATCFSTWPPSLKQCLYPVRISFATTFDHCLHPCTMHLWVKPRCNPTLSRWRQESDLPVARVLHWHSSQLIAIQQCPTLPAACT